MELVDHIDENFKFNNINVRIIGSYNEPFFVAKDICNILELTNITEALKNIPEKWKKIQNLTSVSLKSDIMYQEQGRNMIILSEPAVYKLIMRSNKPIAQKFQEVVCEEILPSLRKKGEYKIQSIIDKNKELEEEKIKIINENKELEEENKELNKKIFKRNKRNYKIGNCVYIVMSPHIKSHFKIGKTDDINARLRSFDCGSPTPFIMHKNWYTRFNDNVERLAHMTFEKFRISLNNEWFDTIILEKVCEYISNQVELLEKFDTVEKEKAPEFATLVFIDNTRTDKKKCTKCLLSLPLYEYYIRENIKDEDFDLNNEEDKEKYISVKYRSHCKKCCNKTSIELRENIKRHPNYNKKECVKCENLFNLEFFYKNEDETLHDDCNECYKSENNLENVKQCIECKSIIDTNNFHKHSDNKLRSECKDCRNKKFKLQNESLDKITCEFCDKEILEKNMVLHQNTKMCLSKQGKIVEKRKVSINSRSKIILQFDLKSNELIKKYSSATEASTETGVGRANIEKCCKNINKTAGNFLWKFEI